MTRRDARRCVNCGAPTSDYHRQVPRAYVWCRVCWERAICAATGARVEVINGQRVFVGLGLKPPQ